MDGDIVDLQSRYSCCGSFERCIDSLLDSATVASHANYLSLQGPDQLDFQTSEQMLVEQAQLSCNYKIRKHHLLSFRLREAVQ